MRVFGDSILDERGMNTMPDEEAKPEGQETQPEAPQFPEWMTQMMAACGPAMREQMEKFCSGTQPSAGCCGGQSDKETAEKV